jgi:hypothetical protein
MQEIEDFYKTNKLKKPIGCADSEIFALEKSVGFELPAAYKDYLFFMGNDYNGVMRGTDCFVNNVKENTDYLPELLKENNIEGGLADNYLVFYNHQGYIASWFNLPKENLITYETQIVCKTNRILSG